MGIRNALIRMLSAEPDLTRLVYEAGGERLKEAQNYRHEIGDYDYDEHPERAVLPHGGWIPEGDLKYLVVNLDETLEYGVRETVFELNVLPDVSWDLVDLMAERLSKRLRDNWYVRVRLQNSDGLDLHEATEIGAVGVR